MVTFYACSNTYLRNYVQLRPGKTNPDQKKANPSFIKNYIFFFDFSCKIYAEVYPGPHLQYIGPFQISRLHQGLGKCSWNTFAKSIHYPETNGKHSLQQNFQLLRWSWNSTCCPGGGEAVNHSQTFVTSKCLPPWPCASNSHDNLYIGPSSLFVQRKRFYVDKFEMKIKSS